ncbi:hypothetical protein ADL21_02350 [Streptomyces albus subsp. albus]|nr:hypothetical protein ADL21_02350 [Streptomyces albus subsp. albus]
MLEADLVAVDPFPGPGEPWAARCRPCGKLSRFVFSEVIEGTSRCPVCRRPHSVLARDQEPPG